MRRIPLPVFLSLCLSLCLSLAPALAGPPEAVIRLNEQGIRHLIDSRPLEALALFERALATLPDDPVLARNTAAALAAVAERRRKRNRAAAAVELLDRAVDLHPERLQYRMLRGRARFEQGRDSDRFFAREDFEHVLRHDADNLDALINLGKVSYLERKLEESVRLLEHALALRPDDRKILGALEKARRELAVEAAYEELRGHKFVVRYAPSIPRETAEAVRAICETARTELCRRFDTYPDAETAVTLYPPDEFRAATRLHAWVAGLSDGTIRLPVRSTTTVDDLRATLYHEYAHHLIRGIAPRAPPWLHEGLAQLAEGRSVARAEARLRRGVAPGSAELDVLILNQRDPRKVSRFYDLSLGFVSYLHELGRDAGILDLLSGLGEGEEPDAIMRATFRAPRHELFGQWRLRLRPR